jgi:hypothetical protein
MTQFEDQFSTIKPDGIQVRCHKQFCIIRCSTVPVPPRAVVAAAVVAAAAVETEGAADPGEGQDPQDLEQGKSSLFLEHVDPNCEIVLFTNKIACNDEHPTCDYAMP